MNAGPRVIVVGAGIAGLTAGFRLQQAGFSVRVLEAEAIVGGRMSSVEVDGFVMNRGAGILPGSYAAIRQLAADVGLGELPRAETTMGFVRDGVIHRMHTAQLGRDGLRTKLLSWRCKLRMAKLAIDAARIAPKLSYERIDGAREFDVETASAYAMRRLGDEARRYVIDPVVRWATSEASVVEYFFLASNLLGTGFMAYPGRMGFVAEALAAKLDVTTNAAVQSVAHEGASVRVTWRHGDAEHTEVVDACVVAVPGELVPKVYRDLDPRAAELLSNKLRYGTVFVGHFGLSERPPEPAGLLMLPVDEDPGMYALVFDHNMRPEAVARDRGQITTYWAHDWCVANSARSDDELFEHMLTSLEKFVPNIRSIVLVKRIDRWPLASMQSYPGYCTALAQLHETLDPNSPVQLAGDYFASPSTNTAALWGERAAANLIARVKS